MDYRARQDINSEFRRGSTIPGDVAEAMPNFPGLVSTRMLEPVFDDGLAKAVGQSIAKDAVHATEKRQRVSRKKKAK